MDGLIFIIVAITFVFLDMKESGSSDAVMIENNEIQEDVKRVSKLNEDYFDDPTAFSIIINNLGFPKKGA